MSDSPPDDSGREDVDESVDVDDFEMYGSPAPTSNGVSTAIERLDRTEPERYLVRWEGETMNRDMAYDVTSIGFGRGGRPTLELEGNGNSTYVIDSNPGGKPRVQYHPPNSAQREERLTMIKIYDTNFEWKNWIKRRLGI